MEGEATAVGPLRSYRYVTKLPRPPPTPTRAPIFGLVGWTGALISLMEDESRFADAAPSPSLFGLRWPFGNSKDAQRAAADAEAAAQVAAAAEAEAVRAAAAAEAARNRIMLWPWDKTRQRETNRLWTHLVGE